MGSEMCIRDRDWSEPKPYVQPQLSASVVQINGVVVPQAVFGASAGFFLFDQDKPHWLSHSRVSATGNYGLGSSSLGYDGRLGSFFGPDGKWVQLQSGPDVWFNGYGTASSTDYYLPSSPGVDLKNSALLKLTDKFTVQFEATPGWAFAPERQSAIETLKVAHELTVGGVASVDTDSFSMLLGYLRAWNSAGPQNVWVLGFGL